jgi:hypothetical protein
MMATQQYGGYPVVGAAYSTSPYAYLQPYAAAPPLAPGAVFPAPPAAEMNAPSSMGGTGNVEGQKRGKGKRYASSEGAVGRSVKKRSSGADMSIYGQSNGQVLSVPDPNQISTDMEPTAASITKSTTCVALTTPATSFTQYCEACEKEFASTAAWEAHVATHEACPHPGCQFRATKKTVGAHWQLVHGQYSGSGLKEIEVEVEGSVKRFKVLMGTSPEEVREWREERKRRFPSAVTVKAKEDERQKLLQAGGLEAPGAQSGGRQRNQRSVAKTGGTDTRDDCKEEGTSGTGAGADNTDGSPGCDGEGRGGVAEEMEADVQAEPQRTQRKQLCQYYTRGRCKHGADCRYVHDEEAKAEFKRQKLVRLSMSATELEEAERAKQSKKGQLYLPKPLVGGERGTLLKRLLQEEVFKEENTILQCFRYLVKHNFLQDEELGE